MKSRYLHIINTITLSLLQLLITIIITTIATTTTIN